MADSLAHVVIPYERFVECRDRRRRIAAELRRLEDGRTIESHAVVVAEVPPGTPAVKGSPSGHEGSGRAKTGEPVT
jgi:hypothetical protein